MKEMAMSFEADMNQERWKLAESEEGHRVMIKQMEDYIEERWIRHGLGKTRFWVWESVTLFGFKRSAQKQIAFGKEFVEAFVLITPVLCRSSMSSLPTVRPFALRRSDHSSLSTARPDHFHSSTACPLHCTSVRTVLCSTVRPLPPRLFFLYLRNCSAARPQTFGHLVSLMFGVATGITTGRRSKNKKKK
ncbi:hypothetical protein LR48_Vigan07g181400 [Vigna angularis]|uniref:Uncharacterized protein n=1 Tax=Phaseolus angularis TaxID=3914 RepID=A0A0L9UZ25_PHAAN|nr:hypothetical protein LR48_Vigan07g181400 [Vigna angularis]